MIIELDLVERLSELHDWLVRQFCQIFKEREFHKKQCTILGNTFSPVRFPLGFPEQWGPWFVATKKLNHCLWQKIDLALRILCGIEIDSFLVWCSKYQSTRKPPFRFISSFAILCLLSYKQCSSSSMLPTSNMNSEFRKRELAHTLHSFRWHGLSNSAVEENCFKNNIWDVSSTVVENCFRCYEYLLPNDLIL